MDNQISSLATNKPSKAVVNKFIHSIYSMQVVTEFLTIKQMLEMQLINKDFYNNVVPNVLNARNMFPSVDPKMHLFLHAKELWGLKLPSYVDTRLVDFEDDEWFQECQYELKKDTSIKPIKLFSFSDIGKDLKDPEAKVHEHEQLLIQYIFQISRFKFLVYPVDKEVKITRGLIVEIIFSSNGEK